MLPPDARPEELVLKRATFSGTGEKFQADYGALAAPENRAEPASRLLQVPFTLILSPAQQKEAPLVYFADGPGQSNLQFTPPDELLAAHDFLMVGYRGVDNSRPLRCPELERAMAGMRDELGTASRDSLASRFSDCAEKLESAQVDAGDYSIWRVIEDVEAIRKGLGYPQINLLAEGFGARLALAYALRHPESVHRMVMLAPRPPGHLAVSAQAVESRLQHLASLWQQDAGNQHSDLDILAAMRHSLQSPPRRWLIFPIDAGKVKMAAYFLLQHRRSVPMLFDTFAAADRGDVSGLAVLTLAYDVLVPTSSNWADYAAKALSSDFDEGKNYAAIGDTAGAIIGAPLTRLVWGALQQSSWPRKLWSEASVTGKSEVETLVLSGNIDFTAPESLIVAELLPHLPRATHLVLRDIGHVNDLWTVQREAVLTSIRQFYRSGSTPGAFASVPMSFDTGFGFPAAAKLTVGAIMLVMLILLALGIFIFRQFRR